METASGKPAYLWNLASDLHLWSLCLSPAMLICLWLISWEMLSWKGFFSWNSLGVHLRRCCDGEWEVTFSYS